MTWILASLLVCMSDELNAVHRPKLAEDQTELPMANHAVRRGVLPYTKVTVVCSRFCCGMSLDELFVSSGFMFRRQRSNSLQTDTDCNTLVSLEVCACTESISHHSCLEFKPAFASTVALTKDS